MEQVFSHLDIKDTPSHTESWNYLKDLEEIRNVPQVTSSTCTYTTRWATATILIGEEHHHESI